MTDEPARPLLIPRTLARLEAMDPAAALDAQHALEWLFGVDLSPDAASDEYADMPSLSSLCRFGLQQFCWYELPFKWIVSPSVREEIVSALARFFDLAGLRRYADLCRSSATAEILESWTASASDGFRAFRRAMEASGLEPVNLPEFSWGLSMEVEEFTAFWSTAMALEIAVDAGVLQPGVRGWRVEQADLVCRHLTQPRDDRLGESLLQAVVMERLVGWIEGGAGLPRSQARAQMLAPIANGLLSPVGPPRGVARAMTPLSWMLHRIGDGEMGSSAATTGLVGKKEARGVLLTPKGKLPRTFVREAVVAFPRWWPTDSAGREPQSESEVAALVRLHGLLRSTKLVRRHGRRLRLTPRGQQCAADPRTLWRVVSESLAAGSAIGAAAYELTFAALLAEPLIDPAELRGEVLVGLTECGWHNGASGEPIPDKAFATIQSEIQCVLLELGMIRVKGRAAARRLRLTEVGRATALAALRARATAPRGPA